MTRRLRLFFVFALIFAMLPMEAADFETTFKSGLEAFQTKDHQKAREQFAEALSLEPGNAAAMTNYALASFHLGEVGTAIAWFRRVLTLEPDHPQAKQGLEFALSQLEIKEIPHRIETYESLRKAVLLKAPLRVFLALTALLILTSGWLLLAWAGRRKRALDHKESPPPVTASLTLLPIFAVVAVALTALKLYDVSLPRGTIVIKKVSALSAPADTGVILFDLHEGFEVLIHDVSGEWAQVTYPGGSTGWIPKTAVLASEGGAP